MEVRRVAIATLACGLRTHSLNGSDYCVKSSEALIYLVLTRAQIRRLLGFLGTHDFDEAH